MKTSVVTAFLPAILTVATALLPQSAMAGFNGSVSFTPQEVSSQLIALPQIMEDSSDCLEAHLEKHQTFFKKWGISPFYGSNSAYSKMTDAQRRAYLTKIGKPAALADKMSSVSCIGLTVTCLGLGFKNAGLGATWKKLYDYTKANDMDGSALQDGLRKLDWKVLYWNPNVSKNEYWDMLERKADPEDKTHFWGFHAERWKGVNGPKHKYFYNVVDDFTSLVNFETTIPMKFKKVPFFVGTAHGGYHVFPGSFGQVIEGHSTRQISDSQTVETSPFNPIQDGGGPRGLYKSGMIAVPPGYGY